MAAGIASRIAGLVQEGMARGYNLFSAVKHADDRLDPETVIPSWQLSAVASELSRRIPGVQPEVWAIVVRAELGHRIVESAPDGTRRPGEPDGASGIPGWAWGLICFGGLVALSALGVRRET